MFVIRRNFLKLGFLSSAVVVMSGCDIFSITTSRDTLKVLQHDLFPQASLLKINTIDYIRIIEHHSRVSQEDKEFLKNGVKWLNEESVALYRKNYTKLLSAQREKVLQSIAKTQWGDAWLYSVMMYLFEAMLGDPIYGGNNNEAGWRWLSFTGGEPRPKKAYL